MRNLLLLLSGFFIISCSTEEQPKPQPPDNQEGPPLAEKHWISNWMQDTLCCMVPSDTGRAKDTLYSFERSDTSMVRYKEHDYYIWTADNYYVPNAKTYTNCYISVRPFDISSAIAGHALFTIEPGVFRSAYSGNLEKQEQSIEDRGLYTFPAPPFYEGVKSFSTKYKSW